MQPVNRHIVNDDGTVTHVDHTHFGFEGRLLDYGWSLALCYHVGFRGKHLRKAVAVGNGESGRYTRAWHENIELDIRETDEGEKYVHEETITSIDRGWFQANSVHDDQLSPTDAFEPIPNARFAFQLSHEGTDWDAWYAYRNKSIGYLTGLLWATWFFYNGRGWRRRVEHVAEELG